uniref:Putative ovule protein n=1 Tax=Solanum chacoense TaxID=4108 RepID=A0A0V0IGQ7_SOLCH
MQCKNVKTQVKSAEIRNPNEITGPGVRESAVYMVYTLNIHLVYIMINEDGRRAKSPINCYFCRFRKLG